MARSPSNVHKAFYVPVKGSIGDSNGDFNLEHDILPSTVVRLFGVEMRARTLLDDAKLDVRQEKK